MRLRAECLDIIYTTLYPQNSDRSTSQAAIKYIRNQVDIDNIESQLWFLNSCKYYGLIPKGLQVQGLPRTLEKSRQANLMHDRYLHTRLTETIRMKYRRIAFLRRSIQELEALLTSSLLQQLDMVAFSEIKYHRKIYGPNHNKKLNNLWYNAYGQGETYDYKDPWIQEDPTCDVGMSQSTLEFRSDTMEIDSLTNESTGVSDQMVLQRPEESDMDISQQPGDSDIDISQQPGDSDMDISQEASSQIAAPREVHNNFKWYSTSNYSDNEKSILEMGPKMCIYQDFKRDDVMINLEKALFGMRWRDFIARQPPRAEEPRFLSLQQIPFDYKRQWPEKMDANSEAAIQNLRTNPFKFIE